MPRMGKDTFVRIRTPGGAGGYIMAPVLTTTQRNALTGEEGMIIFNSTTDQLEKYDGATWEAAGQIILDTHTAVAAAHHEAMPTTHKAMAHPNADQALVTGDHRKITLDVEDFDPGSHFASDKYTVAKAGVYLIIAGYGLKAMATTKLVIASIYKNGAALYRMRTNTSGTEYPEGQIVCMVELAVDDYLELYIYQGQGADIDTEAHMTFLSVHLISA